MRRPLTLRALILTLFALVAAGDVLLQPYLGLDTDGVALVHHARVVAVAAALDDDHRHHPCIGDDAPLVPGAAPLPLPRAATRASRRASSVLPGDRAQPPARSRGPPSRAFAASIAA